MQHRREGAAKMLGELNRRQIEHLLASQVLGRISCYSDGTVYVVPVIYAYDGDDVYAHSAEGMKLHLMRRNPRVCFEVERIDDLGNWQNVSAWGRFEELRDGEARRGLELLVRRLGPLSNRAGAAPEHGRAGAAPPPNLPTGDAIVFRIRLEEKAGRFEQRPHEPHPTAS